MIDIDYGSCTRYRFLQSCGGFRFLKKYVVEQFRFMTFSTSPEAHLNFEALSPIAEQTIYFWVFKSMYMLFYAVVSAETVSSAATIFNPAASTVKALTSAWRAMRCLTSLTRLLISTKTPSFSGCPSGSPISLILTCFCAISSSPKTTAKGTPLVSAALNCCCSFGLILYKNSAFGKS